MEPAKICPLRALADGVGKPGWGPVRAERAACMGPACAWYDAAAGRCAVLTMARGTR